MTKRIVFALTTITLLMSGCAQKKVATVTDVPNVDPSAYGTGMGTGTGISVTPQNVDPYGSGNYGTNNATYDNNNAYAGGSIENLYFDVDQYHITSEKLSVVSNNANILKSNVAKGARVKLEGHCDASGTDEYNFALGLRRAKAAKDALIMKGINAGSISLVSMGESSPECSTSASSECYSKNRRVEFKVVH